MPNPTSPGVYVVEAASGSAPIAGVGTSTPAFLGFYKLTGEPNVGSGSFTPTISFVSSFTGFKTMFLNPTVVVSITTGGVLTAAVFSYTVGSAAPVTGQAMTPASGQTNFVFAVPGTSLTITFVPPSGSSTYVAGSTYTISQNGDVTPSDTALKGTVTTTISEPTGRETLTHAIFGFFQNGGTGCYVTRGRSQTGSVPEGDVDAVLGLIETFDNVQIVAAPGVTTASTVGKIVAHCEKLKDRFAIVDIPAPSGTNDITFYGTVANLPYGTSSYMASYFPNIEVTPLFTDITTPYYISPVGHIAGLYGRVDDNRGVHKAPANEVILGALSLQTPVTAAQQDQVNPVGINIIRSLNGNIRVWGGRTFGGEKTNSGLPGGDFKYVHTRRLFNFIRDSVQAGTQWTVFEPNVPTLWAAVTRNVSAFLLGLWRQGALFGATPEQAFYVKCNEETNPPDLRNIGQLNAEIGVNITQAAEFVIFRLGQYQPIAK